MPLPLQVFSPRLGGPQRRASLFYLSTPVPPRFPPSISAPLHRPSRSQLPCKLVQPRLEQASRLAAVHLTLEHASRLPRNSEAAPVSPRSTEYEMRQGHQIQLASQHRVVPYLPEVAFCWKMP